jgi:hypothetical protein
MGETLSCSEKEAEEIKVDFAEIKLAAREIAYSIVYLKGLLVLFLQKEYAYVVLGFETNKEMVDEIAKCYIKNPKTIYNIINEVLVLIELGFDPGEISQAALLVLKGSLKKKDWKAVFNMALELANGDVGKVTADVMKQAVQSFKGEFEEEDESSDDGSEEVGSDNSEDDQTDNDSLDDDDEEMESPATRGRKKVIEKPLVKKAKSDDSKDRIKPSAIKTKLKDKIEQLKVYTAELQGVVEEMERLAS